MDVDMPRLILMAGLLRRWVDLESSRHEYAKLAQRRPPLPR